MLPPLKFKEAKNGVIKLSEIGDSATAQIPAVPYPESDADVYAEEKLLGTVSLNPSGETEVPVLREDLLEYAGTGRAIQFKYSVSEGGNEFPSEPADFLIQH